ncbi:hypothetical protein BH10PSE18_BH10PSE18_38600 [soil metagenome]
MAGLEFPTQKKPEALSEESAFGGLPTPAWAKAKQKPSASLTEKAAPAAKLSKLEKSKNEKKKYRVSLDGVQTAEVFLALLAIVSFAIFAALIAWFWPELTWMVRRYL